MTLRCARMTRAASSIAEARDSLWSFDLFRCESILLKSFRVMVVRDILDHDP
jgi:hypothetical protein